jgi:putative copper resistance protein D
MIVALAMLFLGSLAWSTRVRHRGIAGDLHVTADVLHRVAAWTWIGGLVPLAMLFAATRRAASPAVASIAREAALRFSTLGVIAVGIILATGLVNTYVLAGSVPALLETDYGHLLLVKFGLFLAIVGIAALNRLRLTPRLSSAGTVADAHRQLQRNSVIEAIMGLLILASSAPRYPPAGIAHPADPCMHGG